ncbi:hypothetical protein MmTuc01_0832 [Methanosarcina mazei Tuc01]|uniref:Uncharacterized protein n=1 Tax=Methanosarcina mazei Tuc01 TaxID=1236903 RepID=M1P737_METMZ|nr:hypothetical protein MmTuc01_0832 [Methanosarcina mazei Tuc01]
MSKLKPVTNGNISKKKIPGNRYKKGKKKFRNMKKGRRNSEI